MDDDLFSRAARVAVFLHAKGHTAESMQQKRGKGTINERKFGKTKGLQSFRTLLFLTALGSSSEI